VRDFLLESFLLYLLTLSFFIKLLLYYKDIRLQLDLHTEVIGFIFLVFIILSRRHRTGHPKMKEESRNQERFFRVRREELSLTVGQLKQGDIMLLKKEENVEVDGIIL
jgi:cation transport ATPase